MHGDSYVISSQTGGRQGPLGVPAIQYGLLILQYLPSSYVVKSEQEVNSTHSVSFQKQLSISLQFSLVYVERGTIYLKFFT